MKTHRTLGIVVNAPGIQERRALALTPHLGAWFDVEVLICPSAHHTLHAMRRWAAVYVIDPGAAGFPAAVIGKSLRRLTVVEVGDPQRELYAAQGSGRLIQLTGRALDAAVAKYADGVVVRGAELANTLNVTVPWTAVPDGVDLDRFRPSGGTAVRRKLGIPNVSLVVGVVGSIQWSARRAFAYGLDVIEAVGPLSGLNVHALIVGDGSGLTRLKQRAVELKLDNVHFVGRVPHSEVPDQVAAMDVCVSTQSRDAIGRARTTAKLPEYLACDRFVLCTAIGTAAAILPSEMLLESDLSRWDEHVRLLQTRIAALVPQQATLRVGAGTRALAVEHFSYPVIGRRLGQFLNTCERR